MFQIKNPRWADYWQQQAYAVMLVIRTSDGENPLPDPLGFRSITCTASLSPARVAYPPVRPHHLRFSVTSACTQLLVESQVVADNQFEHPQRHCAGSQDDVVKFLEGKFLAKATPRLSAELQNS